MVANAREELRILADELPESQRSMARRALQVSDLSRLSDDLPEDEWPSARHILHILRVVAAPPHPAAGALPIDDELLTLEDEAALAAAYADLERGDVIAHERVRQDLGL
jgi:hypothetical protein